MTELLIFVTAAKSLLFSQLPAIHQSRRCVQKSRLSQAGCSEAVLSKHVASNRPGKFMNAEGGILKP
jgi:hypothetical protein